MVNGADPKAGREPLTYALTNYSALLTFPLSTPLLKNVPWLYREGFNHSLWVHKVIPVTFWSPFEHSLFRPGRPSAQPGKDIARQEACGCVFNTYYSTY